ncbi:hypothetical protein NF27_DP00930 [Candidatus Jidaibacter acanthamoeba]|uniref:Transcriptional regulator HTH-type FeoC domain-containing protein n=1 Tax=Candidatus Jidaibacter acanthamoebae TaxID=86105 RepID=A0A0C1QJ68_9RICK|nr:FeoC-like transcriptional regulator [Candidatus Jidaibacter acanthamoeba]KIE05549.1 hypothetical protein NF27_DP00930 [Candidatus Jidaibacter acanthamoeba]
MLILELKKYIIEHPRVSLLEITKKFNLSGEQARNMLEPWVERGKLDRFKPTRICGGCKCVNDECLVLSMELYTWNKV